MVTRLNPQVITDDMMYEGVVEPLTDEQINQLLKNIVEDELWINIREAAKTNKTLQSAMEKCIIIYKLSKEY